MKNVNYMWTLNEDLGRSNNNYDEEIQTVQFDDDDFTFGEYLQNKQIDFEHDEVSDTYYILNDEGERSGEAYHIIDEEILNGYKI